MTTLQLFAQKIDHNARSLATTVWTARADDMKAYLQRTGLSIHQASILIEKLKDEGASPEPPQELVELMKITVINQIMAGVGQ